MSAGALRSGRYRATADLAFAAVSAACADHAEDTRQTPAMRRTYQALRELGHAHSVEALLGEDLAGGFYGVALGGLSAPGPRSRASKTAPR